MKPHARVVIIGGGIIGCSVLYHLTRLGWHNVVLVERGELTSGATWHAAGQNHLYAESSFLVRVAKESFDLYRSLEAETGQACGVHVTGGLRLARNQDGIDEFKRYLAPATALGVDAEIVGPNRVRELWPLLESDSFIGALHTPGEGYVDAAMTTNALAKGARDRGGEINRHTRVTGLSVLPSGEWRTETDKGPIRSEYVVNCAGSWGSEISGLLGFQLPVLTMEHQYLVTEQCSDLASRATELPVLRDTSVPFYCRQEGQGLMLSAFELEAKLNWLDGAPDEFAMEIFPPDLERSTPCLEASFEMVPVLQHLGIRTVVNGPIPGTPDMQGLLGPAHGLRNYFACCGIHGGFVQGGLTRYLAEWIVDGEPSTDLSSVDVRRFGDYATQDFSVARLSAAHTMFSLPANYPDIEPEGGRPARTDGLYDQLASKGAVFGAANGWEVPNWFAPQGVEPVDRLSFSRANWFVHVAAECHAVRERAGVLDLASLSKFVISGPGARAFLDRLSANHLPTVGNRTTTPFLTPSAGVEIVVNIDAHPDDSFFVTAPAQAEQRVAHWLSSHSSREGVSIRNVTSEHGVLLLAGPASTRILERAAGGTLADIGAETFIETTIGADAVRIIRVDDIDPIAWEIHQAAQSQSRVYQALIANGAPDGLADFGMRAHNSLRLERGLPRWGVDFSIDLTAEAARIGHLVALDKADFIGRSALAEGASSRARHTLALLHVDDAELPTDPWGGEVVEVDEQGIGMVTSGARGHTVGISLAFAQLEPAYAEPGTKLDVVLLGERYRAVVGPPPR